MKPRHLLYAVLALPPAAVLVAWLGVFNVGAASGHWAITDWFLHFAMRSSVRTYALGTDPPDRLPREALRPAAGHFARGCAICHGAPGAPRSPAVLAMLPRPPDLAGVVGTWTDAQLFRIVARGVRFTGMPAWPAQARADEVWAMVAFLRALPGLSPADYAALVEGREGTLPKGCAGCHGPDGRDGGPRVPVLAGQKQGYLRAALDAYAGRRRASGFMALPATALTVEARAEIARALAALPAEGPRDPAAGDSHLAATGDNPTSRRAAHAAGRPPAAEDNPAAGPGATADTLATGRRLAEAGRPDDMLPPCLECHGAGGKPAFPRLDGQPAEYLALQLQLFRAEVRGGGPYAHLMTRVARRLTDADIAAASAWFAGRPAARPGG